MISASYTLALPPGPTRLALPRSAVALLPERATAPTREAWLMRLVDLLRPWFKRYADVDFAQRIRVSCSWASSRRAVGECWDPRASADGTWEIMVSYAHRDPMASAETLVHELVHVAVGIEAKHGPLFKRVAEAVGLRGPMRSTPEMTDGLRACLHALCLKAGGYPGAPLGLGFSKGGAATGGANGAGLSSGPEVQVCRQLLIFCAECGVKLRGARGISDQGSGGIRALMPTPQARFACPCGGRFVPEKPEQVWPESRYLLRFLAWLGHVG